MAAASSPKVVGGHHKPLLLLYALARLKHERQTEVRFNTAEAALRPLLRTYGPWGSRPRVSYPYGRLITDGLWRLPCRDELLDAAGEVRPGMARERDAPAGFTPEVLAAFEQAPELIDIVALHLLERHFAPGLHEEILEAVGLELGTPAGRRRDAAFRAAVLEAYLAECWGLTLLMPVVARRQLNDCLTSCGPGSPCQEEIARNLCL